MSGGRLTKWPRRRAVCRATSCRFRGRIVFSGPAGCFWTPSTVIGQPSVEHPKPLADQNRASGVQRVRLSGGSAKAPGAAQLGLEIPEQALAVTLPICRRAASPVRRGMLIRSGKARPPFSEESQSLVQFAADDPFLLRKRYGLRSSEGARRGHEALYLRELCRRRLNGRFQPQQADPQHPSAHRTMNDRPL